MPEAETVAPWIRREAVAAEHAPEVVARREREQATALAIEIRREEKRRERTHFYLSDRARGLEPIA
jgi:hypothetical protein